jgi:uncharacterized protein YecA (UPF0149 family)
MDPKTAEIYPHEISEIPEFNVPVKRRDLETLKAMDTPERKNWMRNRPCPCGKSKKFKRCCW